ncbi:Vacuolar protein 8 [Mortierella sp. GBA30]|nr:Vacuolar protein 8 [Mortierella sp. GBA30]
MSPTQAFRQSIQPGASPAPEIHIDARFDSKTQKHIIRWRDIQQVFDGAKYVLDGQKVVSFMADDNFEDLVPERIKHRPGVVLEVVTGAATATPATPAENLVQEENTFVPPQDDKPHSECSDTADKIELIPMSIAPKEADGKSKKNDDTKEYTSAVTNMPEAEKGDGDMPRLENLAFTEPGDQSPLESTPVELESEEDQQRRIKESSAFGFLMMFLENPILKAGQRHYFEGYSMQCASTLAYSKSTEKQFVAATYLLMAVNHGVRSITESVFKPMLFMMESKDAKVQDHVSIVMILLLNVDENKVMIVKFGGLNALLHLAYSESRQVHLHFAAIMDSISMHDKNKHVICKNKEILTEVIRLARCDHVGTQTHCLSALLALSMVEDSMQDIVRAGAMPVLVRLLGGTTTTFHLPCMKALKYITEDPKNLAWLMQSVPGFVKTLKGMLESVDEEISLQAAMILFNLTAEDSYSREIVQTGCLAPLCRMLQKGSFTLIGGAMALIGKLAEIPSHDQALIKSGCLERLIDLSDPTRPKPFKDRDILVCVPMIFNALLEREANRLAILNMGLVEIFCTLVVKESPRCREQMMRCLHALCLSTDLHPRLLQTRILEPLIRLSYSTSEYLRDVTLNMLVFLTRNPTDPKPFVKTWDKPAKGIHGVLYQSFGSHNLNMQRSAILILGGLVHVPETRELITRSTQLRPALQRAIAALKWSPKPGEPNVPEIHIKTRYDPKNNVYFIRWKDIQQIFEGAKIEDGQAISLIFARISLIPERIEYFPGVTLEVVAITSSTASTTRRTIPATEPTPTTSVQQELSSCKEELITVPAEQAVDSTENVSALVEKVAVPAEKVSVPAEKESVPSSGAFEAMSDKVDIRNGANDEGENNSDSESEDDFDIPPLEPPTPSSSEDSTPTEAEMTQKNPLDPCESEELTAHASLKRYLENPKQLKQDFFKSPLLLCVSVLSRSKEITRQIVAVDSLVMATKTEKNKTMILKSGGLESLLHLASAEPKLLHVHFATIMSWLAAKEEHKTVISKNKEILAALVRLGKFHEDDLAQLHALETIFHLCAVKEAMQDVVRAGAMPVVVRLLKTFNLAIHLCCIGALKYMTEDSKNIEWLIQSVPGLVTTLKGLLDSPQEDVRFFTVMTLTNLAVESSYQREMVQAGCLVPILGALKSHSIENVLITIPLVIGLADFAPNDQALLKSGCLEVLIELMSKKELFLGLQEAVYSMTSVFSRLLNRETNRKSIFDMGLVQRIKSMVLHESSDTQEEMACCIYRLCASDDLRPRMLQMGIIDLMLQLSAKANGSTKVACVTTIIYFSKNLTERKLFIEHWNKPATGIHGLLCQSLNGGENVPLQCEAIALLTELLTYPVLKKLVVKSTKIRPALENMIQAQTTLAGTRPGPEVDMSHSQTFRLVTQPGEPQAPDIHIRTRYDLKSDAYFIRWKDIQQVFDGAKYVMNGQTAISFMTDSNFEDLVPERIEYHPGVTLEIVTAASLSSSVAPDSVPEFQDTSTMSEHQSAPTSMTGSLVNPVEQATDSPSASFKAVDRKGDGKGVVKIIDNEGNKINDENSNKAKGMKSEKNNRKISDRDDNKDSSNDVAKDSNKQGSDTSNDGGKDRTENHSVAKSKDGDKDIVKVARVDAADTPNDAKSDDVDNDPKVPSLEAVTVTKKSTLKASKDVAPAGVQSDPNVKAERFFKDDRVLAFQALAYSPISEIRTVAVCFLAEAISRGLRVVEHYVLKAIFHLIETEDDTQGAVIHNKACSSLITLAEEKSLVPKISTKETLEALVRASRSKDRQTQQWSMEAFGRISQNKESVKGLLRAGAMAIVARRLGTLDEDQDMYCLHTLKLMTPEGANLNRLMETAPRIVSAVIGRLDARDEEVRFQALMVLINLAKDDSYRREIVQVGCLVQILRMLKSGLVRHTAVSVALLEELVRLPANDQPIVKSGCLEQMLGLSTGQEDQAVHEDANIRMHIWAAFSTLLDRESNKKSLLDIGLVQGICDRVLDEPIFVKMQMLR